MELHQLQLVEVPPCKLLPAGSGVSGSFLHLRTWFGSFLLLFQVLGWSYSHTCVLQPPVRRWILQ